VAITVATTSVEATRLQTDSALIVDKFSVPAGSYKTLSVTLGPTSATANLFINTSGSTITWTGGSCPNLTVCALPAGALVTIPISISLTLSGNQDKWIGLNLNLNNAITTSGGLSVDFSQANVLTAVTTPRTGLPSGAVDTIEDFTGSVTALSNSSISVQSAITGQALVATVNSSTVLNVVSPSYNTGCQSGNAGTCIKVGSIVSMNADLAIDGTLTATEIDGLDTTAVDEIEGVIYPTSQAGVVGLILLDKTSASGNSVLSASTTTFGTPFQLNATSSSVTFSVDTGPLTTAIGTNPPGFAGTGSLLAGQTVRVQVSNVSVVNNINTATASNVLLRWSRIPASVNSTAGNSFTLTSIPSYIRTLNASASVPQTPQVITYQNNTAFDGVTDAQSVTTGPVAIRALFLDVGPGGGAQFSFLAAKVRVP
jgi:hypothetical protein